MKIYLNKPTNKSYVNFKAYRKNLHGFNCILTDYDLDAFLPINLVSNKKKIKSINAIVPLNKNLIGIIEDTENDNYMISLAYNDFTSDDFDNFTKLCSNNKKIISVSKRYTSKNNLDFEDFWNNNILTINEKDKYEYLKNYLEDFLKKLKYPDIFQEYMDNTNKVKEDCNIKRIGIVTQGSFTKLQENIKSIIQNSNIEIILDKLPNYNIKYENENELENFIENLKMCDQTFVQT